MIYRHNRKPILLPSKEPLFASGERIQNGIKMYFDKDGQFACVNAMVRPGARICIICGNCCISFICNEDLTYTCSACGKFPQELVQRLAQ